MGPKLRRGAGLGREGRDSHLGVTDLCRCKLKTWERNTKRITWGDTGAEGRHPLDMIRLPFSKAS